MQPAQTTRAPIQAPTLRAATLADCAAVADLHSRTGLEPKTNADWLRMWPNNPAFIEEQHRWRIGWVLERDSNVAGFIGNVPLYYHFGGRRFVVAASHGWAVDEPERPYSLSLIRKFFTQDVPLSLHTTANALAGRMLQAFRCKRVPVGRWDISEFVIVQPSRFSSAALRHFGVPDWKFLRKLASGAISVRRSLTGALPRSQPGTRVVTCSGFDGRFEDFWRSLAAHRTNTLLADRSPAVLWWRFGHLLRSGLAQLFVLERGSNVRGYAVFAREDVKRAGLRRWRLADHQLLDQDADGFLALVRAAVSQAKRTGIDLVEWIGLPDHLRAALKPLAPLSGALSSWRYLYRPNERWERLLDDPAIWNPVPADGDGCL